MKKILSLLLVICMVAGVMIGCGSNAESTQGETTGTTAPSNPSDPSQPTTPSVTQPTESAPVQDATNPTDPTDPAEPTAPTEPTQPTEPTVPTQPTEPTAPTEPVDPNFVQDTNFYYLVGAGAGDLSASNWNIGYDLLYLERQPYNYRNVYAIDVTLHAGDAFQICHDYDWAGQMGIGYIPGAVTDASNTTAEVRDAAGNVVFYGHAQYDKASTEWNMVLANGQDGVYRITLETFPNDPSRNVITFELLEKLEPQQVVYKMHLVGTFNNWDMGDSNAIYDMTLSADGSCYQVYLTAEAGAAFKVVNQTLGTWHPDGVGNDLYIPESGTYLVTYNIASGVVSFEKVS